MLSGRRAVDKNRPSGEHNLVEWAKPYLTNKRRVFRILDTRIEGQYPQVVALKAANLALQCLSNEAKFRPSMVEVVTALEQLQDSKESTKPNPNDRIPNHRSRHTSGQKHRPRGLEEALNARVASYPKPSASPLYA